MNGVQVFLLGLLAFWGLLYLISRVFHLERYGLEVKPAYLMYKSKGLKRALEVLPEKGRVLWWTLCNAGLLLAAALMVFVVYFLSDNLLRITRAQTAVGGVFLILPGITIRLRWLPYFFVAAAIIVMTHEMAHGFVAQLEKISVKSAGVLLAVILLGGFVELDEEEFEKAPTLTKLRLLSAGPSTNLVTWLLALLLLTNLYAPASGILILGTVEGKPLEQAGLQRWDIIYKMNGTETLNVTALQSYMENNVTANDTLILETSKGNITITTVADPKNASRAILGLLPVAEWGYWNYYPCRLGPGQFVAFHYHFYTSLEWIQLLAFGVSIFAMLPAYPFDGERFLYYILKGRMKRGLRGVRIAISAACWFLMAANLGLTFIRYGLVFF